MSIKMQEYLFSNEWHTILVEKDERGFAIVRRSLTGETRIVLKENVLSNL